jgi:putative transposase
MEYFKKRIYKKVYKLFIINNEKIKLYEKNYNDLILYYYKKFYNLYVNNINLIKNNNIIIYNHIKNKLNNIILNSTNIKSFHKIIINELKNIITYNETNKKLVFLDIVNKIIKSFYDKKYFLSKYQINNHIRLTFNDEQLKEDIKKNNYYYDKQNISYKNKIETEFNIKFHSEQYLFKSFVYDNCLNNNKTKLPADVILNIIDKYYEAIKSYYGKLNKKLKANKPKYLNKDELSNLYYYPSSFKVFTNKIRLNVGKHISNLYDSLNYYKINENKYCRHIHIIKALKKNTNKKDYLKIKNGYVNKKDVIESNYLYFKYPKNIKNKKIKLIQIIPYGNIFKINITYNEDINIINNNNNKPTIENSISIDLGMKNLMTIYNPTGTQHIIKGGKMKSINEFYNKKISELKSINKKTLNMNTFNRMYSLLNERTNILNGEINKIINLLTTTYNNKDIFIIGYNHGWKTKLNLSQNNNRMFYEIPFKRIIIKLGEKLNKLGKKLIINEESYTSKCDSLNLEKLGKKENYDGERKNRGLFISKIGKALNADLNGAINIMRKVINMKKIIGLSLFNPTSLSA